MASCDPYYTSIHTIGATSSAPCSPSSQGAKFTEVRLSRSRCPLTATRGLHVAGIVRHASSMCNDLRLNPCELQLNILRTDLTWLFLVSSYGLPDRLCGVLTRGIPCMQVYMCRTCGARGFPSVHTCTHVAPSGLVSLFPGLITSSSALLCCHVNLIAFRSSLLTVPA